MHSSFHRSAAMSPAKRARKLIRRAEVLRRSGYSNTTLWRREREGKFPSRIIIGESGAVAWYEDEIDQWQAARERGIGKRPEHLKRIKSPGQKPAAANDLAG